jgi:predicted glutamine amidotransferase
MCRLLGVTNFDYSAQKDIVDGFCGLARTGKVMAGDPPGHGDGWGLAFWDQGKLVVDKSGGNLIDEAGRVHDQLRRVGESPVMILHLRKSAWSDSTSTRHAHPFHHDNVAFVHNGVVYDYKEFLPEITGLEADALDTEVFFYHFMSARSRGLGDAFLDTVRKIKREGLRFSALNCLFSDGATLYAYRDYSKEPDYYSLYKSSTPTSSFVSSEPLSDNLSWEMMAKEEFLELPAIRT